MEEQVRDRKSPLEGPRAFKALFLIPGQAGALLMGSANIKMSIGDNVGDVEF